VPGQRHFRGTRRPSRPAPRAAECRLAEHQQVGKRGSASSLCAKLRDTIASVSSIAYNFAQPRITALAAHHPGHRAAPEGSSLGLTPPVLIDARVTWRLPDRRGAARNRFAPARDNPHEFGVRAERRLWDASSAQPPSVTAVGMLPTSAASSTRSTSRDTKRVLTLSDLGAGERDRTAVPRTVPRGRQAMVNDRNRA
jgi:hypothetical protein